MKSFPQFRRQATILIKEVVFFPEFKGENQTKSKGNTFIKTREEADNVFNVYFRKLFQRSLDDKIDSLV